MSVNEIGRVVIVVPGGDGGMGLGEHYVGVSLDEGPSGTVATSITSVPQYAYSLIGRVCDGRAVATVGGDIVVHGKPVPPEKYIRLWREALAKAVSPEEAAEKFGVAASLVVRGNLSRQAGHNRHRTTDPMPNFDGWAKAFATVMQPDAEGYFEFALDLREPQAFTAWDHMRCYVDHRDDEPRNRCEMRLSVTPEATRMDSANDANVDGSEPVQPALFN